MSIDTEGLVSRLRDVLRQGCFKAGSSRELKERGFGSVLIGNQFFGKDATDEPLKKLLSFS